MFKEKGTKRLRKNAPLKECSTKRERKDCVKMHPPKKCSTKRERKDGVKMHPQKNVQQKDYVKNAPSPARLQFFTALYQGFCTERQRWGSGFGMINMILLIMMIMRTAFVLRGKDEDWCSIYDLITRHSILFIIIHNSVNHKHNHHDYQP